ncbi:MAG: hypothetical protein WDO17_04215 [Alphaproteobacteria bacterium]
MTMPTPREIMEAEYRRALEKAQEIERDMRDLERIVAKYDLLVVPSPSEPPPVLDSINRKSYSRAASEAEAIIRAAGHPMAIGDLFKIITVDRGMELEGKLPSSLLASAMSTHKKLQFIKDVGWWIRGVPWPPSATDIAHLRAPAVHEQSTAQRSEPGVGRRRSPEKQQLFETIRRILRGKTEPMKFGELFDRVKETGVPIGGQNERQNFASFLSKFSCFESDKVTRNGWKYRPDRDFEEQDASNQQERA